MPLCHSRSIDGISTGFGRVVASQENVRSVTKLSFAAGLQGRLARLSWRFEASGIVLLRV